jgi:hypothetical protein
LNFYEKFSTHSPENHINLRAYAALRYRSGRLDTASSRRILVKYKIIVTIGRKPARHKLCQRQEVVHARSYEDAIPIAVILLASDNGGGYGITSR